MTSVRPRPVIRLAPVPFGYGPVGKALHIARSIRTMVADQVRLELVADPAFAATAEQGLLDAVLPSADACRGVSAAVITVMNAAGIQQFVARGEQVHVVDSLAWLWDVPLPVTGARRYYYQDLPVLPVPERNLVGQPDPVGVPAIGCLGDRRPSGPESGGPVISLSGLLSPSSRVDGIAERYAHYVIGAVERADAAGRLPPRIEIHGNRGVLDRVVPDVLRSRLGSGTQADFARVARVAERVVVSPGLTSIVECLRAGTPVALLPPQNYSQVKILAAFRRAGLFGVGWHSRAADWLVDATLPEPIGADIVSALIARGCLTERHLPDDLLEQLIHAPLTPMDATTVDGVLGRGDGAQRIATEVLTDVLD